RQKDRGQEKPVANRQERGKKPRRLHGAFLSGFYVAIMKQFTIVVKPFCAEAVLRAIAEMDVVACVVREAKGYSRQKGYLDRYVGSEYSMAFLPKVEIGVWVSDQRAQEVADRIARTARTGRMGDGKIFVVAMAWPEALEF